MMLTKITTTNQSQRGPRVTGWWSRSQSAKSISASWMISTGMSKGRYSRMASNLVSCRMGDQGHPVTAPPLCLLVGNERQQRGVERLLELLQLLLVGIEVDLRIARVVSRHIDVPMFVRVRLQIGSVRLQEADDICGKVAKMLFDSQLRHVLLAQVSPSDHGVDLLFDAVNEALLHHVHHLALPQQPQMAIERGLGHVREPFGQLLCRQSLLSERLDNAQPYRVDDQLGAGQSHSRPSITNTGNIPKNDNTPLAHCQSGCFRS